MRIFELSATQEEYGWLTAKPECSVDELQTYDGRSHSKEEWIGKKAVPIKEHRKVQPMGDFTECDFLPVFSKTALEKLYSLIKDDIEIFPLDCKLGDYFLINVTTVLDAFDRENAKFDLFDNSERIMYVEKYAFYENIIKDHNIFKISIQRISHIFVSEKFVETIEKNELTAFRFKLVWDSEAKD